MKTLAHYLGTAALLAGSATVQALECGAPHMLEKLQAAELKFQRDRYPPAFLHAWEDGGITLALAADPASQACRIKLEETLPEADVREATRIIESQPARRIMLLSQGYAVPEQHRLEASFEVDPATLAVAHADTLQVAELGKLRATVGMVYATLSQARAEVAESARNTAAWPATLKAEVRDACLGRDPEKGAERHCNCRVEWLEQRIGKRQMEHIAYVRANPYAYATGALKGYEAAVEEAKRACR
jgi:hypothetical protein